LDKLRLRHNKRRRQRALRHPRIPLLQRSSRLRRDSSLRRICRRGSNLRRICRLDSNRHRRQENLAWQDNLRPRANPECQASRQVLLQPLRRVLLPLLHLLRKNLLVF
jgi:hypothetical protein